MRWLEAHWQEIAVVLAVCIVVTVGVKNVVPHIRQSHFPRLARWSAFAVSVLCGLALGWALRDLTSWLVGLTIPVPLISNLGAVLGIIFGWRALYLLILTVRDLLDGVPDEDARKAALMVPVLLPAGGAAVLQLISSPQTLGSTAAGIAGAVVTLIYAHKINGQIVPDDQRAKVHWKWVALAVSALAGAALVPILLMADDYASRFVSTTVMNFVRVVFGAIGLGLLVAAIGDACSKEPKKHARALAAYGVPLLVMFGPLVASLFEGGIQAGVDRIVG